jgi:hypothetical protein
MLYAQRMKGVAGKEGNYQEGYEKGAPGADQNPTSIHS